MAYRNQNKPPLNTNLSAATSLSTPPTRKAGGNEIRKQLVGRPTRDESASINASSDCGIEFSNEMVDDLLNEKVKVKNKFDYKGKCEQMSEYIKKLRLCINWFQQVEQNHLLDKEKLQILFNSSETKCQETEHRMQETLQHMETQILGLRRNNACLEEKLRKVEADKMAAIESLKSEQEARVSIEGMRASLAEEFERSQQELKRANKTIESLNEACRASQEYNTGLQGYNATLQKECETYKVNHKRLEQEKAAMFENHITVKHRYKLLQEELASFQASRDEALNQKDTLNTELCCLRSELQQARDDRDCQQMQAQNLTVELMNYKELTGKYSREMDNLIVKNKVLEETCSSHKEEIRILQNQLDAANEKLKVSDITTSDTRMEYEDQKRLVQNLQLRLADAEFQIVEAEKLRKKLHNTILELKGNIRVFCRVRPMLPDDGVGSEASVISYPVSTELLGRGIDLLHSAGQKHQFSFDKVFAHDSSQNDVFGEISQLVQSALDGYKVCIFAYGQTGSGKTYTMMGKPETPEQKGLIPRSLEQIFQSSQGLVSQGWKYKMQASMLEIYNETIRDLLSTNRGGNLDNGPTGKQHTIKHDINGNACVSDLTVVDVCSLKQVSSLLNQAAQSRSVGKTQMNELSSRSHFVFTLHIVGFNESTDQQVHGILNLIDLAGSERLSRSGVTGDRLRETQAINKSLSSLSDVIFSLAKKEEHVPFRNSKLTYLLQPCLGGDSKTLMFVNVSPDPSSMGESLCSLRFAAKVNACEIGVPRRQTTMRSSDSRLSYG